MITHVIDEAKSPPDAMIWVMRCGASCIVLDDSAGEQAGELVPEMDYAEGAAEKSDCPACRSRLGLPDLTRRALEPA